MVKKVMILVCFLIVLSGIGIVNAETLTGTLTGTNYSQSSYGNGGFTTGSNTYTRWHVNSIEFNTNLKSLIIFDDYQVNSYDVGASAGETTPFTLRVGSLSGTVIATGTMGYQRLWNAAVPPVEQKGYVWFVFDNGWNVTGLSGDRTDIYCNFSASAVRNVTRRGQGTTRTPPSDGNIEMYANPGAIYLQTYEIQMDTDYIAVAPMGLGISGNATKASGTTSRVYIINPISGATISSEGTQTSTVFNFNIDNNAGTGIIIAAQDSKGNFYNTSTLFSGVGLPTPTLTPTPTMTPVPTVAPGYVRSTLHVWDRAGNHVHGVDIAIRDVEGAVWSNSTSDADGIHYIDTLPYHTLNAYASFDVFENELLPGEVLGYDVGYYGGSFYITLFPYESEATEGNVSFYVEVKDADTGHYIEYANVDMTITSTGVTYSQSTANAGSALFLVPNDTTVYATARKSGYLPQTKYADSGSDTTEVITIELQKATVTTIPTSTIPPGGFTPVVTADPAGEKDAAGNYPVGYSNVKGQQMMDFLASNGMDLVQVCFLITILALFGVKFGK